MNKIGVVLFTEVAQSSGSEIYEPDRKWREVIKSLYEKRPLELLLSARPHKSLNRLQKVRQIACKECTEKLNTSTSLWSHLFKESFQGSISAVEVLFNIGIVYTGFPSKADFK